MMFMRIILVAMAIQNFSKNRITITFLGQPINYLHQKSYKIRSVFQSMGRVFNWERQARRVQGAAASLGARIFPPVISAACPHCREAVSILPLSHEAAATGKPTKAAEVNRSHISTFISPVPFA